MLFKEYHIPMIRSGSKTVTRREWAENYHGPNVGTVVAAKTELLTPDDECDCFIKITDKRQECLGEITEASAQREGDYEGIAEFRDAYEKVYGDGSWDPYKRVTVVKFEYVGTSRPTDDSTEQTELLTDGGVDAEDLLTDDGALDRSRLRSIQNRGNGGERTMSARECRRLRRAAWHLDDASIRELKAGVGYAHTTVNFHLRGECSHDHGEAAPPLAYHHVHGWRPAGEP